MKRVLGLAFGLLAVAGFLFTGCDNDTTCSVIQNPDGTARVMCPDGTSAVVGETPTFVNEHCTIQTAEDGAKSLVCPDGTTALLTHDAATDPIDDPDDPIDEPDDPGTDQPPVIVTPDQLTQSDLDRIDLLRGAIAQGLDVGKNEFVDEVAIWLSQENVTHNYDGGAIDETYSASSEEIELCPFVKYYDNGFIPTGVGCDFIVELAKVEMYAELSNVLEGNPLPAETTESEHAEAAGFWYEQGAISGIEQYKVLVRSDLKSQMVCDVQPTPTESAYDKGFTVGAGVLADAFNDWLTSQGHTGDYPAMTNPIEVCNVNESALDPAKKAAVNSVKQVLVDDPLCDGYQAPTAQHEVEYAQAMLEYEKGIKAGIEAEFSLAAVRIFKVVPCNVGDPLVIDLDGDGIELRPVHRGVNFDFYGVGTPQAVAWVAGDDGLIVRDVNGNGLIDDGSELFGNVDQAYSDGFMHLSTLDSNADGVISGAEMAELQVWQDADGDAVTDAGELTSLSDIVSAVPLVAAEVTMRDAGVRIPMVVQAGTYLIGDALFQTAPYASPSL